MSKLTDQQVLTKCVAIAVENGWEVFGYGSTSIREFRKAAEGDFELIITFVGGKRTRSGSWTVNDILFDHDFAKALFGESKTELMNGVYVPYGYNWENHLQALALAKDRLDYLREWLNE